MKTTSSLSLAVLLAGVSVASAQDGVNRVIVSSGVQAQSLTGAFTNFSDFVLNGSGTVAFLGYATSSEAIYRSTDTGFATIAAALQTAPTIGGAFNNFSGPMINDNGTVAFYGQSATGGQAIYCSNGGALTTIVTTGQTATGLSSPISEFPSAIAISDSAAVAFRANALLTSTSGLYVGAGSALSNIANSSQTVPVTGGVFAALGAPVINGVGVSAAFQQNATGSGIYASFGTTLVPIVTSAQTMPELGGNFTLFSSSPAINDAGLVAFKGFGLNGKKGIFAGSGGALSAIATTARLAPGLPGNFSTFVADPALSNSGVAAFIGSVAATVPGFSSYQQQGIYLGSGGALQTVAVTGQAAPGAGGNFLTFGRPSVNDFGATAFLGTSTSLVRAGVQSAGIYLGDGQQLVTAAFTGQSLGGSTITALNLTGGTDRGGSAQVNNNGQIVYQATLADLTTKVMLFTPALHYRAAASGSWATRTNWTVGILPAAVHDVFIDPASALTVTGPTLPMTVKSLTVNGTGSGIAELSLQNWGAITASGGVTTGLAGKLSGTGSVIGNLTNGGILAPGRLAAAGSISISGNVSLQNSSRLAFDIGGLTRKTGYDFLGVSGSLALGGALDLSFLSGFIPRFGNTFDLFDAATTTGSFSALNLPSLAHGLLWETAALSGTGVVSIGTIFKTWNVTGGGSWATAGNWAAGVPNANGAVATFGPAASGAATVTVSGAKTVGSIVFNNPAGYTVTGGATDTITLADDFTTPDVGVLAGSDTIAAPLVLAQNATITAAAATTLTLAGKISGAHTLTVAGSGTLNLDGVQSYSTLNANAGTTRLHGSFTGGTATINANAATNIEAGQSLAALNIGNGAVVTFGAAAGEVFAPAGFTAEATVVPEPATLGLLVLGALGVLARRRR